ncbi:MAG: hypothetical protein RIQ60_4346 [Pseudomonadota bacterium]|jgi:hypothetical protein
MNLANSVFISYAADDPDWPHDLVVHLADALKQRGARVRFDLFYRQQLGRKPSDDEWLRWMRASVNAADKIICLCSPRYLKAANRDVADPRGYGVAFEAQKLIHQLYQEKGFNRGRITCVLKAGSSKQDSVPVDLRLDCARYGWPSEREELLEDLCRYPVNIEEPAPAEHPGSHDYVSGDAEFRQAFRRRHESHAVKHLRAAPEFLRALQSDLADREPRMPWFTAEERPFIEGLCQAEKEVAHHVMRRIRRVLKDLAQPIDEATRQAAASLYMLCACRWTRTKVVRAHSGRVVRVPDMMVNPIAVLASVMFGGQLALQRDDHGEARPIHAYEISPSAGEDAATNLLIALFVALCPEDRLAPKLARQEKLSAEELHHVRAAVTVRIDEIENVDEISLTLVVDCPEVFEQAAWVAELNLRAFARDPQLAEDLFVIAPRDLDLWIKRFWRDLDVDRRATPAAPAIPTGKEALVTTPGNTNITINAHGSQFALSTGDQSTACNAVTQSRQGAELKDLLPLLAELRAEIATLAAGPVQDGLNKHVAAVERVVQTKPADAKSRFEEGMKNIKVIADLAGSADKLAGVIGKVVAAAAPILGNLI